MSDRRKLTPAEAGRLGGLAAAHNLGELGRQRRASSGGQSTVEKYGAAHMTRLAFVRHGRLAAEKANAGGISAGVPKSSKPAKGMKTPE